MEIKLFEYVLKQFRLPKLFSLTKNICRHMKFKKKKLLNICVAKNTGNILSLVAHLSSKRSHNGNTQDNFTTKFVKTENNILETKKKK